MWAWLPASLSKSIALSWRDQSGIYWGGKYRAVSTASVVMSHLWWSLCPLLSPTKIFTDFHIETYYILMTHVEVNLHASILICSVAPTWVFQAYVTRLQHHNTLEMTSQSFYPPQCACGAYQKLLHQCTSQTFQSTTGQDSSQRKKKLFHICKSLTPRTPWLHTNPSSGHKLARFFAQRCHFSGLNESNAYHNVDVWLHKQELWTPTTWVLYTQP
jgi:hypothetical protein